MTSSRPQVSLLSSSIQCYILRSKRGIYNCMCFRRYFWKLTMQRAVINSDISIFLESVQLNICCSTFVHGFYNLPLGFFICHVGVLNKAPINTITRWSVSRTENSHSLILLSIENVMIIIDLFWRGGHVTSLLAFICMHKHCAWDRIKDKVMVRFYVFH